MLDEIKTIKVSCKGKEIELMPSFMAFKKLHKNTGNAFKVMDEFVNDTEKRIEHLPVLIQSMAIEDLTIEEIENNVLGMQWSKVTTMANVIFELINSEFIDQVGAEESSKNTQVPKAAEN